MREAGSTIAKAQIEWWAVHNSILEAATLPTRVEGRILGGDYPGKESFVFRLPVGVVSVISPWNWPLHLSMRSVAPALAAGNAVVVKPAADTPITGGLLIAKRTMLELGGNGPLLVTEDVDIDRAAHVAAVGKFLHHGQMCIAVNRIIVADAIHDAFVESFVAKVRALKRGKAGDPETTVGPVINRTQLDRITRLVDGAKLEGARLLLGGPVDGLIMPPHVLDGVTQSMKIARTEIFGPVATILRAKDDDDAIRMANDTEYGLTSGVLCRDLGRAMAIAKRIEAGMTHINDIPAVDMPNMPFGGEKNSGIGRFGSRDVLDEFTTQHWISVQHGASAYPF